MPSAHLVEYAFFAALSEEGLHAFDPGRGGAELPIPLELVHVLAEHVPGPQCADQIVKLCLLIAFPAKNRNELTKYFLPTF